MKNLFKNKKQKTVWIICVILILFCLLTSSNGDPTYDPINGFFIPLVGFVVVSFILTAVMQDK